MAISTFMGGVHPYDGKELAKSKPIVDFLPKEKGLMVYPLSQHIGAPAKAIVDKGDKVLVGQKIAEAGGFVSAPVISSVSGTVKGIEKKLIANGQVVDAIIVQNDNQYEAIEGFGVARDYTSLSKQEIIDIVREAGIVGLGGAGFPTHVKLSSKKADKITHFLVNGAECEPYLTSDYRDMMETPEKIVKGLKLVLTLFPNARGYICVEDNKPDAIEVLRNACAGEDKIEVASLKTKYPQGGERQLIYAMTQRKTNSNMLPEDVGVMVDNIDTIVAIYEAVCESRPLVRRILTFTGDAVNTPGNFRVPTGSNYQELVDFAGGFRVEPEKVISGGPMMGTALYNLDIPVTKNSSSILAFAYDEVLHNPASACIKCGKCVSACPLGLMPTMMMTASLSKNAEKFEKLYGMDCIECGCCTYACPAKRPLTQAFKQMKKELRAVLAERAQKAKAEEAKKKDDAKQNEEVKK